MNIAPSARPFLTLYYREIRRFIKVAVQTVFAPVCEHRLQPVSGGAVASAAQKLLEAVPVVRRQ